MTEQPAAERSRHRLLVVEDEPSIRTLLEATLRLTGYEVRSADTGRSALLEVERLEPHLVVLDVMLPDLDGFEVTRRLRAAGNDCPVLFLTARTGVDDRISGLTAGGDDYVAKPFSIEEVLLRIEAILRRTAPAAEPYAPQSVLRYADLELDEGAHEVHRANQYIALSPTEFKLLAYLLSNVGQVVSKMQILDHVWSYDFAGDARIIETYVRYLRRKIDRFDPPLIHTVRGVGYCLRLPRESGGTSEQ
ncbi:response regulator transcription factor [Streptomyces pseudovenezuelae]|uniref:Two-component system OmpR family response regulator n=1 Tax=Streptomyces pseudovenezuelae TaxID=67350 RepID=A0ABT6LTV2_9ACTN|nr:response regulator transcription factor [Streptomyces pseudovenezuelae]MDH6219722.1 two-component system OmpR family response regulator [Streptomyces pseudovenezuelae]